jgi:recombination protein RecT
MSTKEIQANKPRTIQTLLITYKDQITAALPKHLTADRMSRIALTEIRRNPNLLKCDPVSLFGAVIQASQLGLEIGPGGAHLVPFKGQIQMIPDYRGLMAMARRSGDIMAFYAQIVKANDLFSYQFGTEEYLHFKPATSNRGEIIGAFAIAKFKEGGSQFEYMTVEDINEIRDRSKAKNSGPWVTDYEPMAKKTVIRQICKYLPVSVELQKAINLDELNDRDVAQDNRAILDGEFMAAPEEQGKPEVEMPKAATK